MVASCCLMCSILVWSWLAIFTIMSSTSNFSPCAWNYKSKQISNTLSTHQHHKPTKRNSMFKNFHKPTNITIITCIFIFFPHSLRVKSGLTLTRLVHLNCHDYHQQHNGSCMVIISSFGLVLPHSHKIGIMIYSYHEGIPLSYE